MYSDLISALPAVLSAYNFAAVVIGVIAGIVVGAMPGLSATMARQNLRVWLSGCWDIGSLPMPRAA